MDAIQKGWFSEILHLWPGQSFSLKVDKVLHEEKSKYQDIKILETTNYGTALILDGVIQCTTRDEFSYQEMIAFIALCSHRKPEKVLIVGGGDGGVAREVVKHPDVKEVHQVEIDDRVVELSKQYLPSMACGFDNPKVKLTIGDGFEYMKSHRCKFDVIITDSSDPIGPAVSLFQDSYYQVLKDALLPSGVICSQGGTFWTDLEHIQHTMNDYNRHFPVTGYAVTSIPSYPCGHIGLAVATLDPMRRLPEPTKTFTDTELDRMNLKYYSSAIHRAAFTLPRFVEKAVTLNL